ncbi:MAG: HAD-IIB family hydrolase [Puniceicoccaceae bacterium]
MENFNFESRWDPRVLATDLDGTLIPLPGSEENRADLRLLAEAMAEGTREVVFATGRHLESVLEVMESDGLPRPEWMVCDVGSSIYRRDATGAYRPFEPYDGHLAGLVGSIDRAAVERSLAAVGGLVPQDEACQGRFKISYFAPADRVEALVAEVSRVCGEAGLPFACMGSVDPFENKGLLDLLPARVSKAYALIWLSTHADFRPEEVVYAGDSGNDLAALVAGFRAIAVGNMDPSLADRIERELGGQGRPDLLFRATKTATSGVLEGCRHFGLVR